MATASDLADWWEKNRQQTAGYSDRALTDYVQAHPGLFAVGDIRSGSMKRVASSVGEGSAAVRSIHTHLAFGS